jgi:hypothetical protein
MAGSFRLSNKINLPMGDKGLKGKNSMCANGPDCELYPLGTPVYGTRELVPDPERRLSKWPEDDHRKGRQE